MGMVRIAVCILLLGSALLGAFDQNEIEEGGQGPDFGEMDLPDSRNTKHNFQESDVESERDAYGDYQVSGDYNASKTRDQFKRWLKGKNLPAKGNKETIFFTTNEPREENATPNSSTGIVLETIRQNSVTSGPRKTIPTPRSAKGGRLSRVLWKLSSTK